MTTIFGDLTKAANGFDLEFVRLFDTDVADVWSAVTDPERLARWMAPYRGELRLGGTWEGLSDDGSVWVTGTVTACDPPHTFTTTWHAIEEQPTELTVTVDETPDGARMRLVHTGVQSMDYGPGWQTYLERLDDLLGAAAASVTDPERTPGIGWDDRYLALREPWRQQFDALRADG